MALTLLGNLFFVVKNDFRYEKKLWVLGNDEDLVKDGFCPAFFLFCVELLSLLCFFIGFGRFY
jgi:hypothetical protein